MCTLDTDIRKLYEEVRKILENGCKDLSQVSMIFQLLRGNYEKLESLKHYVGNTWFFSWDGYIEFMPNSSYLLLISLRDLSFQVYLEDEVFLVGDSDQYLRGYEFHKDCPFFSSSDDQTNYGLEEFATAAHQVSAA